MQPWTTKLLLALICKTEHAVLGTEAARNPYLCRIDDRAHFPHQLRLAWHCRTPVRLTGHVCHRKRSAVTSMCVWFATSPHQIG